MPYIPLSHCFAPLRLPPSLIHYMEGDPFFSLNLGYKTGMRSAKSRLGDGR